VAAGNVVMTVYEQNPRTRDCVIVQEWAVKDGKAVLLRGRADEDWMDGIDLKAPAGEVLEKVHRSVNNTYLFAEVARGQQFLFSPRDRLRTKLDAEDAAYAAIFEGVVG